MVGSQMSLSRRWFALDEKVRFVIAGICNMGIRYLIFVLLGLAFTVNRYQIILLATWLSSSVIAFLSYKYLVFRTEGNHIKRVCQVAFDLVFELCSQCVAARFLVGRLQWNVYAAQGLVIILIVVINYLLFKHFAFKNRKRAGWNICIIYGNRPPCRGGKQKSKRFLGRAEVCLRSDRFDVPGSAR